MLAQMGLCNGRMSVCPSVRPIVLPQQRRVARCGQEDIDRQDGPAARHSAANAPRWQARRLSLNADFFGR